MTVSVIIPAKCLRNAKSRLAVPTGLRRELALAMLCDTVAAVEPHPRVDSVLVVTNDSAIRSEIRAQGAAMVVKEPAVSDMNSAIAFGRAHALQMDPTTDIVVTVGDLPGVMAADLDQVLHRLEQWQEPLFVRDAAGSGTTFLLHPASQPRPIRFGLDSARRHQRAGYREILDTVSSLRQDVDVNHDLSSALANTDGASLTRRVIADAVTGGQLRPNVSVDLTGRRRHPAPG